MTRTGDQAGFMLIELLVAIVMTAVLMGLVVLVLTSFTDQTNYGTLRNEAQGNAHTIVDQLSRELRSAASPSAGSAGLLEKATTYDLVFQTVNANTVYTGNPTNQYRVRYCLDSKDTLWRQTETWTSSSAPSVPDTSACPSTSSSWVQSISGSPCCQVINDVANVIGSDALFTFGPTGWSTTSQIKSVEINLIVNNNPGQQPGPIQLTSGVYLRNELAPPVASFTITQTGVNSSSTDVELNGSASFDPQGQALTYQWYNGGSCPTPSGVIAGATTQEYNGGDYTAGSNQTFLLTVTDTAGLSTCSSQTVTIT